MGVYIPNITLEQLKDPNNLYIVVNGQPFVKKGIIEIPTPHGRLIDAEVVDNYIIGSVNLRDVPTIIDAEE